MSQRSSMFRFLRCHVGPHACAIDLTNVVRLCSAEEIISTEESSALSGYIDEAPIYWLAELLGVTSDDVRAGQQVVIVRVAGTMFGFRVDRVSQVSEATLFELHALSPIMGELANACFQGILLRDGELLPLLAIEMFHPDGSAPTKRSLQAISVPIDEPIPQGVNRLIVFQNRTFADAERPVSFGLSMAQVLEVAELTNVIPIPGTPEFVKGLVAWRDRAIPVLDLAERVGLPPEEQPSADRLLICRTPEPIALLARAGTRILRLPIAHVISDRDLPVNPEMIFQVVELDRETLILPAMNEVVKN